MKLQSLVATVLIALAFAGPARAEENYRDVVAGYMDGLKTRNYVKALHYLGIDVRPDLGEEIEELVARMEDDLLLAVRDYRITGEKVDGSLAIVTVEETRFLDIGARERAELAESLPLIAAGIAWGDSVVTERFVLVRLDGRWQFDCSAASVPLKSLQKSLMTVIAGRGTAMPQASAQREMVAAINGVGVGEFVQSNSSMLGMIMIGIQQAGGTRRQQRATYKMQLENTIREKKEELEKMKADLRHIDGLIRTGNELQAELRRARKKVQPLILRAPRGGAR